MTRPLVGACAGRGQIQSPHPTSTYTFLPASSNRPARGPNCTSGPQDVSRVGRAFPRNVIRTIGRPVGSAHAVLLVFVMNVGIKAVPAAPLRLAEVDSCDERQSGSPSEGAERPTGLEVCAPITE
jgi:hypothetical protein